MMPRITFLISFKKIAVMLSVLVLIFFAAGCGGGGGSGGGGNGEKLITIAGKVDDGTANSPISKAKCEFVDLDGDWQAATTADSRGNFKIGVEPDQEGYIRCSHPEIVKLNLSAFVSTEGLQPDDKISGEDVTPTSTVVADIIHSENPAVPQARKLQLMDAIEKGDAELNLLVDASTILCKAMLVKQIDVFFGGGPGADYGGGAVGDTGDGADFSPIPNARCEFVAMELDGEDLFAPDLKEGDVLYDAALADFCNDGTVNRPDLEAIAEQVNKEFEGRQTELMKAFKNYFSDCVGHPYRTIADDEDSETPGRYFLPIPPGVQGFVRCTPPGQPKLKLATFVSTEGLAKGEKISGQDVTPATTFFSHSIATKLSDDLSTVKENFLDDIAGLGEVQIKKDGEEITGFELEGSADPNDEDVGIVAFSAASLFNILYKNGKDVDYLTALDNLIDNDNKEVDSADLVSLGISKADADKWAPLVNASNKDAGDTLGTSLTVAFSTARIKVRVTDRPGGAGIAGAEVDIQDAPSGVVCQDCPGVSDNNGEVILTLTGVPETVPTPIMVETSSATGYEDTTRMIYVVAFATVDLEIPFSYNLTVQGSGNGNGTVTSVPGGIDFDTNAGVISGDNSAGYDYDTEVTLAADPSNDSDFDGWSGGGCSGTADCTVTMDGARTVTATFTLKQPVDETGSLRVTISPTAAVSAGVQWRVDGGSWRNSGYTQSGLSVGNHTVEFSTVSGWNRPANQTVTITHSQTTSASGTYSQQTGSLRVTISPTSAISAGAQWRVDGGNWRNSGYTQSGLSVGSHTVEFSTISNWAKPGNQAITITHNQTTSASGAYSQLTGSLRVTISPTSAISAGAQWRVDGGIWRSSGYTQSGLAVGSHTVEFSTLSGWTKPANQTVTINNNQTTAASGTYAQQTGSLRVTILPSGAVSAGARWRVDGGTWRSSGYTQSGLAVGNHTVEFSTVSGWNRPGNQTVTINNNQTTAASGTYAQQTGSLRVTISPTAVVSAGARWRVDGGTWRSSGYTQSGLAVGGHTVEFSTVSGWNRPSNQTVTINNNQTTAASGTYTQQTGSLRVTILPSGAVSAGAQWRVDGGTWRSSGYTLSGLSIGNHMLEFSTLSGWNRPANQTVSISANQTTTASGTYVFIPQTGSLRVTILPSGAVSAGAQWRVDSGSWRSSGYTLSGLSIGNHTLEFSTLSGWNRPANQTVSISANQTTTASGTYVFIPQTGSLRVTILPSGAVSAGAQWRVDSGSWRSSGYTQSGLTTGNHTVEFSTVSGWNKPANQSITIYYNEMTTTSGTYIMIPAPTISNISDDLLQLNTGSCYDYPGADPYPGSVFGINFDYVDPDEDVIKEDGAKVYLPWDNTPWSTFTGSGYSGSIETKVCFNFGENNSRTFTVTLDDAAGNKSNSLSITINRPPGAN
jgi:hypothetical protein